MNEKYEIRKAYESVYDKKQKLQKEEYYTKNKIVNIRTSWKGTSGERFIKKYMEDRYKIEKYFSEMNNMGEELRRLKCKVQQAEAERRKESAIN